MILGVSFLWSWCPRLAAKKGETEKWTPQDFAGFWDLNTKIIHLLYRFHRQSSLLKLCACLFVAGSMIIGLNPFCGWKALATWARQLIDLLIGSRHLRYGMLRKPLSSVQGKSPAVGFVPESCSGHPHFVVLDLWS